MVKPNKTDKVKPRTARGFRDLSADYLAIRDQMIGALKAVYESFGFERLETPVFEHADCLGKFLPDVDRPENGVFCLRDDNEDLLSLRYDLTAPLARYYAANEMFLPKPYRRYQTGAVFRNEKPGPGRFREFHQFDADTVGTAALSADAEWPALLSAAFGALEIPRGDYEIKVGHRNIMSAVMEKAGLRGDDEQTVSRRGVALRAIDKIDRLGAEGVKALLGEGRKDASGDYTEGAKLSSEQADVILSYVTARGADNAATLTNLRDAVRGLEAGEAAVAELETFLDIAAASGGSESVTLCPSVVRGLGYYTGIVLEAELTFEVPNEKGEIVRFGSVAGGGRYDNLVTRFTGRQIPATGVSIGADRLLTALLTRDKQAAERKSGLVVVCAPDKTELSRYSALTADLRRAGLRTESYVGDAGLKAQLKYADKRGAAFVVIEGEDERAQGAVSVKDLRLGAELSEQVESNEAWRKQNAAQTTVSLDVLVAYLKERV